MNKIIFIPGQIPSLKNSKIMGRFPSKTVMKWLRLFGIQGYSGRKREVTFFKTIKGEYNITEITSPIREYTKYPLKMEFHFVRNTKGGGWDFNNCNHILTDLMTALGVIPDDNVNYVLPFPYEIDGKYWTYDKENPGVILKITELGG